MSPHREEPRRHGPRSGPRLAVACLIAFAGLPSTGTSDAAEDRRRVLRREITPELRLSVSRGLRHLISKQSPSGDFDSEVPVAANALVGLAFLAGGHHREGGPPEYTRALEAGTAALLRRQSRGYFHDSNSKMYGHGFATLFLAELYGTPGNDGKELRAALVNAIEVIEKSQAPDGGWDYDPAPQFLDESRQNRGSDTSITVCQTLALRAARNLGLGIDDRVIGRARSYIEAAQNADGGFRYRQGVYLDAFASSAFPRSAAGVCILFSFGDYESRAVRRGIEYLARNYTFPWSNLFPYYAHYYCAQAMFQAGGKAWEDYHSWVLRALLREQRPDGSWRAGNRENDTQATAMALIVLQLPYRFLPIHER